jgi:hypothetical protein
MNVFREFSLKEYKRKLYRAINLQNLYLTDNIVIIFWVCDCDIFPIPGSSIPRYSVVFHLDCVPNIRRNKQHLKVDTKNSIGSITVKTAATCSTGLMHIFRILRPYFMNFCLGFMWTEIKIKCFLFGYSFKWIKYIRVHLNIRTLSTVLRFTDRHERAAGFDLLGHLLRCHVRNNIRLTSLQSRFKAWPCVPSLSGWGGTPSLGTEYDDRLKSLLVIWA